MKTKQLLTGVVAGLMMLGLTAIAGAEQKLGVNLRNFNTVETHIQMDR
jgi:hypothetical protein